MTPAVYAQRWLATPEEARHGMHASWDQATWKIHLQRLILGHPERIVLAGPPELRVRVLVGDVTCEATIFAQWRTPHAQHDAVLLSHWVTVDVLPCLQAVLVLLEEAHVRLAGPLDLWPTPSAHAQWTQAVSTATHLGTAWTNREVYVVAPYSERGEMAAGCIGARLQGRVGAASVSVCNVLEAIGEGDAMQLPADHWWHAFGAAVPCP